MFTAAIQLLRLTAGATRGEIVVGQRLGVLLHEWDATGGVDPAAAEASVQGPMIGRIAGFGVNIPIHAQALVAIEMRAATSGAPEVFLANKPASMTISLSHRANRAACAIAASGAALGCDLEIVERRSESFLADYFTTEEQALAARASPADQSRLLNLLWSGKESGLKALPTGLRLDTRGAVVTPVDALERASSWRELHFHFASGPAFHGWWQRTGDLVRTLVAAPQPGKPILLKGPTEERR